jgi:hypothetical protein
MNDVGVGRSIPHTIFCLGSVSFQFDLVRVEAVDQVTVLAPPPIQSSFLSRISGDSDFTPMDSIPP